MRQLNLDDNAWTSAASRFGLPDTGLLSLPDMVEQARSIADAVEVPVIADADQVEPARS